MSVADLIGTGIIMGTLHVLTGPDHLSALATLSSTDLSARIKRDVDEPSSRQRRCDFRAFMLGIRWGIGHSIGLLVVGGILILIQAGTTSADWIGLNTWVTTMLDVFVGLFMLGLGSYGVAKALRNKDFTGVKSRKLRRLTTGSSHGSGVQTLKADNKSKVTNRVAVKSNLVLTGSSDVSLNFGRRDSIVSKMTSALNRRESQVESSEGGEDGEPAMSDADRRLWHAAKSFSDNLTMYASDDEMSASAGKSLSESVVTIPMGSIAMDDLQRIYDKATSTGGDVDGDLGETDSYLNQLFEEDDYDTPPQSSKRDFSVAISKGDGKESITKDMIPVHRTRSGGKCFMCTPGLLALLTGLLHGVAGPGGVLGVIPAVEMQDADLAITYLGTFCITSTLVMGGFAAFYGRLCYWMAGHDNNEKDKGAQTNRVFLVEFGSACLSVMVGIIWLTLLAVGELDEVFP